MELTKLEFAVNTDKLKEAVDLLGEVEKGTAALGDAEGKRAPRRKKLTDEEIKALEVAKATAAAAKKAAADQKKMGEEGEVAASKLSKLKDQLRFLRGEIIQGETGFTKMQAGVMATARAAGVSDDILREYAATFDNFNRITGQNPFDKSVGGLKSLDSELNRLQKTTELASQGFKLTQNQIKSLAQDTEALTQVNKARGASEEEINKIVSEHTKQFGAKATQLNDQIERSKELEKQTKNEALARVKAQDVENKARLESQVQWKKQVSEFAGGGTAYKETMGSMSEFYRTQNQELSKSNSDNYWKQEFKNLHQGSVGYKETMASMSDFYKQQEREAKKTSGSTTVKVNRELAQSTKWLANEEAKMVSVLNSLNLSQSDNNSLNEKASRSIANYERNLRQAGITGADAAKKLELYRVQQAQIQSMEQKNQGKFLSRALQPQIGDVAVSLAAGQNPLTVLLQQGDQVRGLIAQSGLKGKELQAIMASAFKDTLGSIKDTAVAMGSVLGGAVTNLGKSIWALPAAMINLGKVSRETSIALDSGLISSTRATRLLDVAMGRLAQAGMTAVYVAGGALLLTLGSLAIAAYQVSKQEDELSKSLALTGGSMGLNKDAAIGYANALNASGVSTSKAIDVMTAMAKEGGFLASEIDLVTITAVKMQKDAGVAIEDTVKHFAKLKEKPVEAILELAKSSGMISSASLEAVIALQKQGDQAGAVALAMKISADVQEQQAARINRELSALGSTVKWFADTWNDAWDRIKNSMFKETDQERLTKRLVKMQDNIASLTAKKNQGWSGYSSDEGKKQADALIAQYQIIQSSSAEELRALILKQSGERKVSEEQSKGADIIKDKLRLEEDLKKRQEATDKDKLTRQQAINKAIADESKLRRLAGGTLSAEEVGKISSTVGREFDKSKEKGNISAANKEQSELNKVMNSYNDIMGIANDYSSSWNEQIANLDKGLAMFIKTEGKAGISAEQYAVAREKLFDQQPYAKAYYKAQEDANKQLIDDQKMINDLIASGDDLGKNFNSTLARLEGYKGKAGFNSEDIDKAIEALKKGTPAAKALDKVQTDYAKTMDEVALANKAVQDSYGSDFITEELTKRRKIEEDYYNASSKAESEYDKAIKDAKGKAGTSEYDQQIALARKIADAKIGVAENVRDRERYLQSETFQLYSAGFDALKGLAKDFGSAVTDEFMNFATTGKSSFEALTSSFGSMVEKMIYDLIRLRIQKQVTGLFDQLITMGVQSMMGPTSSPSTSSTGSSVVPFTMQAANGAAFSNGVQMYAKGGVFDSPTMFQHSGGLGVLGEAGSEAVMPLKRDSSGSLGVVAQVSGGNASATSVVINNYSSEKATATESVDSRGQRSINVTIGDAVAGELNRSGSASQKAMQGTFGMKSQLIRR